MTTFEIIIIQNQRYLFPLNNSLFDCLINNQLPYHRWKYFDELRRSQLPIRRPVRRWRGLGLWDCPTAWRANKLTGVAAPSSVWTPSASSADRRSTNHRSTFRRSTFQILTFRRLSATSMTFRLLCFRRAPCLQSWRSAGARLPSTVERMKPWPSSEDRRQRRPLKRFKIIILIYKA